jgi:hypothetical protein
VLDQLGEDSDRLMVVPNNADAIVVTESLILVELPVSLGPPPESPDIEVLFTQIPHLLADLRFLSRQATLPQTVYMMTHGREIAVPSPTFPFAAARPQVAYRKYIADWAVSQKHIAALERRTGQPLPVAHSLLLDAVQAGVDDDYRRTLLYSAMATETAAATALDDAYAGALSETPARSTLRVRSFPEGGGRQQVKDPVFAFVRERGSFAQLLNELPLYLFGRSLLLDDEPLFHAALRLYRTRNKIAHWGEPPGDGAHLQITRQGANDALETAFRAFAWFGEEGGYVNPLGFDLVSIE